MSGQTNSFFDTLAKVLLRCWLIGFALLLVWLAVVLLMSDVIHSLHGSMFGLNEHELDLILYCGMGLLKLCVLTFFFIPWVAIKLVLRNESSL